MDAVSAAHANSPFAIVPWEVFADPRLGKRHLKVIGALLSFRSRDTGLFWATREQVSERCGLPIERISATTTELEALGWLVKHGNGGRVAVRYEFHVPATVTEMATVTKTATVTETATVEAPTVTETVTQPLPKQSPADTRTDTQQSRPKERARVPRFTPPTEAEVADYCRERGRGVDPERWFAHYTSNGWRVGKNPMRDWRAAVRTWERNDLNRDNPHANRPPSHNRSAVERVEDAIRRKRAEHPELYEAEASGIDAGPPVGANGGPLRPCLDVEVRRLPDRAGCR